MASLEEQIIAELKRPRTKKQRYNFTLSPSTKEALLNWCKAHGFKESTALEHIIRKVLPNKYFKS